MQSLDAIAAVDGVDVVFAGSDDFFASPGVIGQLNHLDLRRYLAEFLKRVADGRNRFQHSRPVSAVLRTGLSLFQHWYPDTSRLGRPQIRTEPAASTGKLIAAACCIGHILIQRQSF